MEALALVLADDAACPVELPASYLSECTDNYNWTDRALGEGAFGQVFRAVDVSTGQRFAVKKLRDTFLAPNADPAVVARMHRAAKREVVILSHFRHPHIVRLLGYAIEGADRCLVYNLLPGGSLDAALREDRRAAEELTWRVRVRVAAGVLKALSFLHGGGGGEKCFHRDVKAANICLTASLSPQLIDCGLAKHVSAEASPQTSSDGRFGTPG